LEVTPDKRFAFFKDRASSYCDGDQPRCRWTGAPYVSSSVRSSAYRAFLSNINAVEIKRPSILERIRGAGPETRVTFTVVELG
jgi:hypothetical protein